MGRNEGKRGQRNRLGRFLPKKKKKIREGDINLFSFSFSFSVFFLIYLSFLKYNVFLFTLKKTYFFRKMNGKNGDLIHTVHLFSFL